MDRINGAGHIGHLFVAEDTGLGQPPTEITAAWLNGVQEEVISVITGSGQTPDAGVLNQLLSGIKKIFQSNSGVLSGTGGTADAITGAYSPAITALGDGMMLYIRAVSANATTTPTFKADGTAAKTIVKGAGAALAVGDIAGAGHWLNLQYDATLDKWVLTNPANGIKAAASIQGQFKNLQVSATGLSANVSVTCAEIAVESDDNAYQTLRSVNLTIAGTSVGANALDAGTIAASTWYSLWVIRNGTTTAGLMSLSATAPTLPGGYTHKARVGWIRTDASGNKYPLAFVQLGPHVQYKVASGSNLTALPVAASGVIGTWSATAPTYAAVSLVNFLPSTSAKVRLVIAGRYGSATQSNVNVAPNASYSGVGSSNVPPAALSIAGGGVTGLDVALCEMVLESTNVYACSQSSGGAVLVSGWEDNL